MKRAGDGNPHLTRGYATAEPQLGGFIKTGNGSMADVGEGRQGAVNRSGSDLMMTITPPFSGVVTE